MSRQISHIMLPKISYNLKALIQKAPDFQIKMSYLNVSFMPNKISVCGKESIHKSEKKKIKKK